MKRSDLIDKLETVEPAISSNPIIPLMLHYWFTGEELMAFNDQIALTVPFRTRFRGAVSKKLSALLKASSFESVNVSSQDGNLLVKEAENGRTAVKLAMLPPDFPFTMPTMSRDGRFPRLDEIAGAIKHCLLSAVGSDTSVPEHLGITTFVDDRQLTFYSTDSNTMCRSRIRADGVTMERAILGSEFCRQLVRLYGSGDEAKGPYAFAIAERSVGTGRERYALFAAGDIRLFGRIIGSASPLNFPSVIASLLPSRLDDLIEVPPSFGSALDRASIVCDAERKSMKIVVRDGGMRLLSQTETEEVQDAIAIDRSHPDVSVMVEPKMLRKGGSFEKMLIKDNCVIMSSGPMLFLVSCRRA